MKSGNFNFLEPSWPIQACKVTALLFIIIIIIITFMHGIYTYIPETNCDPTEYRVTAIIIIIIIIIPPSNGIVRWWLFPEFCKELPLVNCTATIILNNPVFLK